MRLNFAYSPQRNKVLTHLCMLLLDVSLEPLERVRRLVVNLTPFPEAEEQVLAAIFSQVAIFDVKR